MANVSFYTGSIFFYSVPNCHPCERDYDDDDDDFNHCYFCLLMICDREVAVQIFSPQMEIE